MAACWIEAGAFSMVQVLAAAAEMPLVRCCRLIEAHDPKEATASLCWGCRREEVSGPCHLIHHFPASLATPSLLCTVPVDIIMSTVSWSILILS